MQAEVVEEEQVRREPAPQFPLEGVVGPGLRERLQEQSRAIVGASRSARVTTALRLSTTSRRGTPPQNLHAASRPSRNRLEILLERVTRIPYPVPASGRRIGPQSQQAESDLRHLAEWRLDDPHRHRRRPEPQLALHEAISDPVSLDTGLTNHGW